MKLVIEIDKEVGYDDLPRYLDKMKHIADTQDIVRSARHFGADEGKIYNENGNAIATWRLEA